MKFINATGFNLSVILLSFCSCDLGLSDDNEYQPSVHTVSVKEHQSGLPVEGVSVGVSVEFNDGGGSTYYGITNAGGNTAIESPHGMVTELRATKAGYVDYCNLQFQSPVILKPIAYLMLHVKNGTPSAATDKLNVLYPEAELSCYGGVTGPAIFTGIVDDTVILRCIAGNNLLRWVVTSAGASQVHSRYNVAMPKGDTTFYEIIY